MKKKTVNFFFTDLQIPCTSISAHAYIGCFTA